MKYTASDGSKWHVRYWAKPVPTRAWDWDWCSDEYDGAPDAGDTRCGNAPTAAEAKAAIEAWVEDNR